MPATAKIAHPWEGKKAAATKPAAVVTPIAAVAADVLTNNGTKPVDLSASIDELAKVRAEAAALEKREKELKELLKPLGAGLHRGHRCAIEIKEIETERFDSKTFKAEQPELYEKYKKPGTETRISIKPLI